jgi:hypothetical protein
MKQAQELDKEPGRQHSARNKTRRNQIHRWLLLWTRRETQTKKEKSGRIHRGTENRNRSENERVVQHNKEKRTRTSRSSCKIKSDRQTERDEENIKLESSLGNGLKTARPDSVTEQENTLEPSSKIRVFPLKPKLRLLQSRRSPPSLYYLIENQHEFLAHF